MPVADDPFDDPRLTAMGLLVEVFKAVTARTDEVHARRGLTGTDFDTLIRLARSPSRRLRMTDLAAQTGLSSSGITRIVDRLERDGLARREAHGADRRSLVAVLTDQGRDRLAADVPELVAAIDAYLTGVLPPAETDALLASLRRLRDAIVPEATGGPRATAAGRR